METGRKRVTQFDSRSTERSERQKKSHAKTEREDGFGTRVNRGNGDLCCVFAISVLQFEVSEREELGHVLRICPQIGFLRYRNYADELPFHSSTLLPFSPA
jgi:hypothetical protein